MRILSYAMRRKKASFGARITSERKSNKLTMKSLISLDWIAAVAIASILAAASNGLAAGTNQETGRPVKSHQEAERLPVGSRVTLACATCKTVWNTEVDRKKGFLAWFEPKTKHECPGCGGYMTAFAIGDPSQGLYHRYYTHTCSICGADSAACSASAHGHKPAS